MRVAEKTIRRDLGLFDCLGFPLEKTVGDRGRNTWKLTGGSSQPPLTFTFNEAVVLYLGRRFLEPLACLANENETHKGRKFP